MKVARKRGFVGLCAALVLGLAAAATIPANAADSVSAQPTGLTATAATSPARPAWYPYDSPGAFVDDVMFRATWAKATDEAYFFWTSALKNGSYRGEDMAAFLFTEPSASANEHFIARSYVSLLGRTPDASGYYYWIARTRNQPYLLGLPSVTKATTTDVVRAMTQSAEFQRRFGSIGAGTNAQFVDKAYLIVLGRSADAAGRAAWTKKLDDGLVSRAGVLASFLRSGEATKRYQNRTKAIVPLFAFFNGQPQESRVNNIHFRLASGEPYPSIMRELLNDPNYFLGDK